MTTSTHPADGALIAYLDEPEAHPQIAAHVSNCSECQARLDVTDRRSANLSALFARADAAPAPPKPEIQRTTWTARPRRQRHLAVAAAVVALGTAIWFSPLKARLTEWFASTPPVVEVGSEAGAEGRIEFPLEGRALLVRITTSDAGVEGVLGSLTVTRGGSGAAAVHVSSADGTETVGLNERELSVDVGHNRTASVQISLPERVEDVELWVGTAGPFTPEWTAPTDGGPATWSVDLQTLR